MFDRWTPSFTLSSILLELSTLIKEAYKFAMIGAQKPWNVGKTIKRNIYSKTSAIHPMKFNENDPDFRRYFKDLLDHFDKNDSQEKEKVRAKTKDYLRKEYQELEEDPIPSISVINLETEEIGDIFEWYFIMEFAEKMQTKCIVKIFCFVLKNKKI